MLLKTIRQCGWIGFFLLLSACNGPEHKGPFLVKQPARFVGVQGLGAQSGGYIGTTGPAGDFDVELTVPTSGNSGPVLSGITFNLMKDVALPGAGMVPTLPPPLGAGSRDAYALYETVFVSAYTVSSDPNVQQNVMLVLAMVDADGDPTNGIQIPAAVANGSLGSTVNWSSTDPTKDFADLLAKVQSLDPSGTHNWSTNTAAVTAHFGSTWSCAMVGRYTGGLVSPTFTNTSGTTQSFQGTWATAVTPTGAVGRMSFTSAPYQFDGQFRYSGPVQPALSPSVTATVVQYVDTGQFAPPTDPQLVPAMSLQTNFTGTGQATGTWTGGGYSGGQLQNGTRLEMANSNNNTTEYQPFTGSMYRFMQGSIWGTSGTSTGEHFFDFQADSVHADGTHTVWASVSLLSDSQVTTPVIGQIAANNTVSIQQSDTNQAVGYDWKFDGTFDQTTVTLTGTLTLSDGTTQQWGITDPEQGCPMQ